MKKAMKANGGKDNFFPLRDFSRSLVLRGPLPTILETIATAPQPDLHFYTAKHHDVRKVWPTTLKKSPNLY